MKITKRATNLGNSVFIFHIYSTNVIILFETNFSYSSLLYILEMIYILLRNHYYCRYIYLRWSAGDCSIFHWFFADVLRSLSYFIIIIILLLSFSHLLGTQIRFYLIPWFFVFFLSFFSLSLSFSLYLAFYISGIKKSVCLPKKKKSLDLPTGTHDIWQTHHHHIHHHQQNPNVYTVAMPCGSSTDVIDSRPPCRASAFTKQPATRIITTITTTSNTADTAAVIRAIQTRAIGDYTQLLRI